MNNSSKIYTKTNRELENVQIIMTFLEAIVRDIDRHWAAVSNHQELECFFRH